MNDSSDPPPKPEDLSDSSAPDKPGAGWNFRDAKQGSTSSPMEKSSSSEQLKDVFESLDDSGDSEFAADKERISQLQRQVREKRRVALAHSDAEERKQVPFKQDADTEAENEESAPPKKGIFRLNFIEWVLVSIFLSAIGLVLLWTLKEAADFPKSDSGYQPSKVPIQGELARVVSLRDFWREPVVTGDNPDRPQLGMKLIPVIEITLGEASSSGILRFFFRDPKGQLVGDPRSVEFENGRFKLNGAPTIQVSSTTGFTDPSAFNRYKYEELDFWTVDVLEGLPNQDAAEYKLLFSHDIGANLDGTITLELYE